MKYILYGAVDALRVTPTVARDCVTDSAIVEIARSIAQAPPCFRAAWIERIDIGAPLAVDAMGVL